MTRLHEAIVQSLTTRPVNFHRHVLLCEATSTHAKQLAFLAALQGVQTERPRLTAAERRDGRAAEATLEWPADRVEVGVAAVFHGAEELTLANRRGVGVYLRHGLLNRSLRILLELDRLVHMLQRPRIERSDALPICSSNGLHQLS